MEWTDELVITLITRVQGLPCLWDPKNTNKKNRNEVQYALKSIAEEMGADVEDVKKKKDTIFQTYRNYRRKVASSIKFGVRRSNIYKPSWAPYKYLDAFLREIYAPKKAKDTTVVMAVDEMQERVLDETRLVKPRNKRSKRDSSVDEVSPRQLVDVGRKIVEDNERSECDIYAELIAARLKKMNEKTRQFAMHTIDNVIYELTFSRSSSSPQSLSPRSVPSPQIEMHVQQLFRGQHCQNQSVSRECQTSPEFLLASQNRSFL